METRGDVITWGLCDRHTDTIINIKLSYDDAYTYIFNPMVTFRTLWERIKKDKYGKH